MCSEAARTIVRTLASTLTLLVAFDEEGNALPVVSVFDQWTRGKSPRPKPKPTPAQN